MLELCTPVVFGSSRLISFYKKALGSDLPFVGIDSPAEVIPGKLNIVNLWEDAPRDHPRAGNRGRRPTGFLIAFGGHASPQGWARRCAGYRPPINKKNIQREGFAFPGHTEYLAAQLGGEPLMFLVSDRLKIAVATGHISLAQVTEHITAPLLEKRLTQMERSLQEDFCLHSPRIAVLGLDPHNGDEGVIGTTDSQLIAPTIARLFDGGHYVFGPYSSDGFFGSGAYTRFDGVLAMYHDQGLIPFKTIAFEDGVNFTAGLPKVRTSPDHGTAYDIAGKGLADESSMRAAVYRAIDILRNRSLYRAMTQNPLRTRRGADVHEGEDEDIDINHVED